MDTLARIRKPIEAELALYKQHFDDCLAHQDDYLGAALQHVRSRVGKMMRPILVLLIAKEFAPVTKKAIRGAVTLELLHTASLIHDDVVDDSNERRGKASLNAVFGNKVAVLVGDYMLSCALLESARTEDMRIVNIISRLGGTLSEGEVKQLANIRNAISTETAYFDIIEHKTAALFEACARVGAISAGASEQMIEAAAKFARIIGLCFQIRDDIFDYYDDANIGKPTGNDMAEGKLTLPAIYVVNNTDNEQVKMWAAKVKEGSAAQEEIAQLVEYTKANGGLDYAEQMMHGLREEAAEILKSFHNEEVRASLQLYLDFTIDRTL